MVTIEGRGDCILLGCPEWTAKHWYDTEYMEKKASLKRWDSIKGKMSAWKINSSHAACSVYIKGY